MLIILASGLYNPKGYDPTTTTREEFFDSLNRASEGSAFYGVSIKWSSNIVTLLSEVSVIDSWFLIGSIVGMIAIVAGDVYMVFMLVVAWKDEHEAEQKRRNRSESINIEGQFESSSKPLMTLK